MQSGETRLCRPAPPPWAIRGQRAKPRRGACRTGKQCKAHGTHCVAASTHATRRPTHEQTPRTPQAREREQSHTQTRENTRAQHSENTREPSARPPESGNKKKKMTEAASVPPEAAGGGSRVPYEQGKPECQVGVRFSPGGRGDSDPRVGVFSSESQNFLWQRICQKVPEVS
jgi:hypothetical protein